MHLRSKIALVTLGLSGAVMLGFGTLMIQNIKKELLYQLDRELISFCEGQMRGSHPRSMWANFDKVLQRLYKGPSDGERGLVLRVQDGDGELIFQSASWPKGINPPQLELTEIPEKKGPSNHGPDQRSGPERPRPREPGFDPFEHTGEYPPRFDGEKHRDNRRLPPMEDITFNGPHYNSWRSEIASWRLCSVSNPWVQVSIARNLEDYYSNINAIQRRHLMAMPIALLLLAMAGWYISGKALKPIYRITQTAARINSQNLNERISTESSEHELQQLVHVLNKMLDRLEAGYEQANRFSADASHELKTPLAILQGVLEQGLHEAENGSSNQQRFADLLHEVQRLKVIIRKLLLLAQVDSGTLKIKREPTDLCELLREMYDDAKIIRPELTIQLSVPDSPVFKKVDRPLLIQAIQNLMANALKYTLEGGSLSISLEQTKDEIHIRVANTAHEISPADAEHLFERFFRIDAARTSSGNVGLGLSLAREIMRAHHGTLELTKNGNPTVEFTASFLSRERPV